MWGDSGICIAFEREEDGEVSDGPGFTSTGPEGSGLLEDEGCNLDFCLESWRRKLDGVGV